MEFKDTLEKRLDDPEFCRELVSELLSEVRELIKENNRLRKELADKLRADDHEV